MQKVVIKVDWSSEKSKKKAIKMVSENKDVQGFAVDEENKQLTVDGDMDPVSLVKKMRKQFPATEIVFMESEASKALEPPTREPSSRNSNNPYHGYRPHPYDYSPYPDYGHPHHHNPYPTVPSAPPYWVSNGYYYGPQ